jgi:hypothetical protein
LNHLIRRALTVPIAGVLLLLGSAWAGAATQTVVYGFGSAQGWHHPAIRPRAFYFGAGGSLYVTRLTWSTWRASWAESAGRLHLDDCIPDCARGTMHAYAATVVLSKVREHRGQPYFARMAVRWVHHKDVFTWSKRAGASAYFWNLVASAGCYPLASSGHCYEPGELCPAADHGMSGVAGDGKAIVCENRGGWRWEPAS